MIDHRSSPSSVYMLSPSRDVFRCRAFAAFASIRPNLMCTFYVCTLHSFNLSFEMLVFLIMFPPSLGNEFFPSSYIYHKTLGLFVFPFLSVLLPRLWSSVPWNDFTL